MTYAHTLILFGLQELDLYVVRIKRPRRLQGNDMALRDTRVGSKCISSGGLYLWNGITRAIHENELPAMYMTSKQGAPQDRRTHTGPL